MQRNFHEGSLYRFINRFNYCVMKKLVLFAAVAVAISLSACKKAATTEPVIQDENVPVVVDEGTGDGVLEVEEAPVEEVAE